MVRVKISYIFNCVHQSFSSLLHVFTKNLRFGPLSRRFVGKPETWLSVQMAIFKKTLQTEKARKMDTEIHTIKWLCTIAAGKRPQREILISVENYIFEKYNINVVQKNTYYVSSIIRMSSMAI